MRRMLGSLLALLILPSLASAILPTHHAAAVIARKQAACPVPSLGYWKFNESDTTTTAVDSVGSNDGTLTNMTGNEWEAGHLNNALRFDGTNDEVDLGDIAAIDAATELSVCAWVNHDTLTGDDAIFSSMNGTTTAGLLLMHDFDGFVSGRTLTYTINIHDGADADSTVIEGATNAATTGTWTHVCFTYIANTASGLRLYVDGTEDANSPVDTTGINSIDAGALTKLIGNRAPGQGEFDGVIDNVQLHEGVWTQTEITALYKGGAGCESN